MLLLLQSYAPAVPRRAYLDLRRRPTTDIDEMAVMLLAYEYYTDLLRDKSWRL